MNICGDNNVPKGPKMQIQTTLCTCWSLPSTVHQALAYIYAVLHLLQTGLISSASQHNDRSNYPIRILLVLITSTLMADFVT